MTNNDARKRLDTAPAEVTNEQVSAAAIKAAVQHHGDDASADGTPAAVTGRHGSGSSMFFLPRLAVLLASAISIAQLYQTSARYLEPLYGNVFAHLSFTPVTVSCFVAGVARGYVQVRFPSGHSHETRGIRRLRTWRTLGGLLDMLSLLLAAAPYTVGWLLRWSDALGPLYGPHITQLFLSYGAFVLLGIVNGIACFSSRASVRPDTWISGSAPLYAVGLFALTWLFAQLDLVYSCETLLWLAALHATLSALIKLIVTEALRVQLERATARNGQSHPSMRPSRLTLRYAPQFLVVALVSLVLLQHPQCHRGLQPSMHNHAESNYTILARTESATGHVSVVEESTRDFRILRSGHSVLGGRYRSNNDSIYLSFYFMEAGRMLIGRKVAAANTKKGKRPETALSLGLGIGVSADSLIKYGQAVDIAELDPAVYQYARDYFDLPEPRNAFLEDGRAVVERTEDEAYDYVLHDVFTGGSVPKRLFSLEFLQQIRRILKPNGVLTLNYVGPIDGPDAVATWSVWRTLREVFPQVAAYKQSPDASDSIINIVFFASALPIKFRKPVEDDYLGSNMRYHALNQLPECLLAEPDTDTLANAHVITDDDNQLDRWQRSSALEHWKTMRLVLPLEFWINY